MFIYNVIDYKVSPYCHIFIDFLINANLCILNGRNLKHNDFTSISPRGCAVVDYCLVPYEQLEHSSDFKVIRCSNLLEDAVGIQRLGNSTIPDHSILTWMLQVRLAENVKLPKTTIITENSQIK